MRQIHGDTEATLQCVLCLRAKVDVRKSYHCSTDCFRKHWHLHRDLHGQPAQRNGANLHDAEVASWLAVPLLFARPCGTASYALTSMFGVAGFVGGDGAHVQPDNGFKGAQGTYSNGGETWMEVRGRIAAHAGSPSQSCAA